MGNWWCGFGRSASDGGGTGSVHSVLFTIVRVGGPGDRCLTGEENRMNGVCGLDGMPAISDAVGSDRGQPLKLFVLRGWAGQAVVVSQRRACVIRAEQAALLEDRDHVVCEGLQARR